MRSQFVYEAPISEKVYAVKLFVQKMIEPIAETDRAFFEELFKEYAEQVELGALIAERPQNAVFLLYLATSAGETGEVERRIPDAVISLLERIKVEYKLDFYVLLAGDESIVWEVEKWFNASNVPVVHFKRCQEFHYILFPLMHYFSANTVLVFPYTRFGDRLLEMNEHTFGNCFNIIFVGMYRSYEKYISCRLFGTPKDKESLRNAVQTLCSEQENFPGFLNARHFGDIID